MHTQTIKTTIEIDAKLLHLAKQQALNAKISLKEVVNASLKDYLGQPQTATKTPQIGGHHLGGVKGNLSRTDIYEDF